MLVCSNLFTHHTVSIKEVNYLFPLYLYTGSDGTDNQRHPNFSKKFCSTVYERLGIQVTDTISLTANAKATEIAALGLGMFSEFHGVFAPNDDEQVKTNADVRGRLTSKDILYYAYAIFHSPAYRARYGEFLRMDFPRLPITSDVDLFRKLCVWGAELVGLHLMETLLAPNAKLYGEGDNKVEALRYEEAPVPELDTGDVSLPGRVYINRTQYFAPVPSEVYEFHIGGYQVCNKWLKDRKGRTLTTEDIAHYAYITEALQGTIDLMAQIDADIEEHGGWPLG